jgi:hypothetical protein
MWADMNRIALIRARREHYGYARSQHALSHIRWLVVSPAAVVKLPALHLGELVDQHVTRGLISPLEFQAPAEGKTPGYEARTSVEFWEWSSMLSNASQEGRIMDRQEFAILRPFEHHLCL